MAGKWSLFLDSKYNYFALVIFLAHKISFSCSPLLAELVELDRKSEQANKDGAVSTSPYGIPSGSELPRKVQDEDTIAYYLKRPRTLIRLIKRYHGVGMDFLVFACIHFILLMYLGTKAFFPLVVGDWYDSQHYSTSWFPRMLESYPNPESFYKLCVIYLSYYMSLRGLCTYRLIKNAIVNRNGYQHITISQVNFTIAAMHDWKKQEWIDFMKMAIYHRKHRAADVEARRRHMSFDKDCKDIVMRCNRREVMYYNNVIDFSRCYGDLLQKFDLSTLSSWASKWHIAQPTCRQDVEDAGRLFILQVMGFSALFSALVVLSAVFLFYEASKLTPNPNESTILETIAVFPDFVTNFSHFIRYVDMMIVVIVQFPNHIEAGLIYWDMTVMISRTQKVCDAIRADLDYCDKKAREFKQKNPGHHCIVKRYSYYEGIIPRFLQVDDYNIYEYNIEPSEKKMLNENIDLHTRLASILNLEFLDLKRTHTLYLNLLFVGSGFCISLCLSLLLVSKSSIVSVLMAGLAISCFVPLFGMVLYCVQAETAFRELYHVMNKLLLNEGNYIDPQVIKRVMVASSQFERTHDRSFQIAGQYPITPGTLGPYIAYISTCIILITRFL